MTISIGVQGASGGLGASSLVAALGLRAAQSGRSVVCVDHRSAGGGLDVVLGAEQVAGLRWPDLHRARGALDGTELLPALPVVRGVGVVACDRRQPHEVPPDAMEALRRGLDGCVDVVVHDLPPTVASGWPAAVLGHDLLAVVAGGAASQVAAAAAVSVLLRQVRAVGAGVVARTEGMDAAACIADLLHLPMLGVLRSDRGVQACLDRGVVPGSVRGPLRDLADEVLLAAVLEERAA